MTKTSGIHLKIPGRPPAKSNRYRIVRIRGFPRLAKAKEITEYEDEICQLCTNFFRLTGLVPPLYPEPLELELIVVWHKARTSRARKDISNILKSIEDGLTAGGIWSDDHQVKLILLQRESDAPEIKSEWVDLWITPTA